MNNRLMIVKQRSVLRKYRPLKRLSRESTLFLSLWKTQTDDGIRLSRFLTRDVSIRSCCLVIVGKKDQSIQYKMISFKPCKIKLSQYKYGDDITFMSG